MKSIFCLKVEKNLLNKKSMLCHIKLIQAYHNGESGTLASRNTRSDWSFPHIKKWVPVVKKINIFEECTQVTLI